eukprot:4418140-Amphidinium_carterae.2
MMHHAQVHLWFVLWACTSEDSLASMVVEDAQSSEEAPCGEDYTDSCKTPQPLPGGMFNPEALSALLRSVKDAVHQHVRPRPALISLMKTEDATGLLLHYN